MDDQVKFLSLLEGHMRKLKTKSDYAPEDLNLVFQFFSLFYENMTSQAAIGFTTLFSRVAYVGINHQIPSALIYENHLFRKRLEQGKYVKEEADLLCDLGLYLIKETAQHMLNYEWSLSLPKPNVDILDTQRTPRLGFKRVLNGYLIKVEEGLLSLIDDDTPHVVIKARITNKLFDKQIERLTRFIELPLSVNLIDVSFVGEHMCEAQGIVLRPDLLITVTAVSECYASVGANPIMYLGKKLIPSISSVHMLIGNIVNNYLDELIHHPDLEFKDVLKTTFKMAPEMFTLMKDSEVKECLYKVQNHFANLKKVVNTELAEAGITKEQSYLEPSFYSNEYGLQGRLDLYHHDETLAKSDIVELKSGKVYKAHTYGLNQNHYVQTLLYDLLIESVYNGKVKSSSYILYSGNDEKRLRFAAKVRSKQLEAMKLRNNIICIEEIMTKLDQADFKEYLNNLNPDRISSDFNFLQRDAKKFWQAYKNVDELESAYYRGFLAFISREYRLSKIGQHGVHTSNGLAALWLDPLLEKIDSFTILSYLEIVKNETDQPQPTLTLRYTEKSNKLSKFRVGEITVLYPYADDQRSALSNQLYKCTILELSQETVKVRLRARQKNFELFRKYNYWNLEGDSLDSGYRHQYHGLFDFINAPKTYRDKILSIRPPQKPKELDAYSHATLTDEQHYIINKAIQAQEYFLLWGPPGTGKTSVMIAHLIKYYVEHTDQKIILLAYTNKAVDEICAAVESQVTEDYLRIGSRYSTDERYTDKLLSIKTEKITNRSELQSILMDTRIYVSTISSYQGKRELHQLIKFDVAIIDEASQLLEPMSVGLLAKFPKFVLIGDHKQLPAVVTQAKEASLFEEPVLIEAGFEDARVSLFERLYRQAIAQEWDWCYGALTMQGRMHQDILDFVSPEFYEDKLSVLPHLSRLVSPSSLKYETALQETLIKERLIFIDAPVDPTVTRKNNRAEALLVAQLTEEWLKIYELNNIVVSKETLGIITPFRSQIARINEEMAYLGPLPFSVDTIERYQGGSREQVLISLAINEAHLLDSITSISEDGIDRKLNVALTRAKEHMIILGSKHVLSKNETYARLIAKCKVLNIKSLNL